MKVDISYQTQWWEILTQIFFFFFKYLSKIKFFKHMSLSDTSTHLRKLQKAVLTKI